MAASAAVGPGPRLKQFIFTEKLGSGTYATVYKAYRKGGQREVVAVKCVLKSSLNKISTENLLTEIELLKSMKHENIVQLKDFQWDENYIYLIMEYCCGGDLSRFIRAQRTLSEYMAKRFLQQIALALQYMRSKNVSHMDLKPQNILMSSTSNPILKIGDFGFAHYLIGETNAVFLRGSPLYMAPEIIIRRYYNEKADLWSVGVIMYECLFGRPPFHSKTFQELEVKIKDTKPIEFPYGVEISWKCRDLLQGLLQRDPKMRMSFHHFFTHCFIDLEHRPSKDSLPQAIKLARTAVEHDTKQDYKPAISCYCQALEFFIPAIHHETDPRKKQALREKVKEYMERAEELKVLMKPGAKPKKSRRKEVDKKPGSRSNSPAPESPRDHSSLPWSPYEELVQLSQDHEKLSAALKVIISAEQKEEKEDYENALAKYELALEALISLIKEEPKGRRRDLLQSLVPEWMTRAEKIKSYLEVQQLNTKDTSAQEEADEQTHMTNLSSCVVQ